MKMKFMDRVQVLSSLLAVVFVMNGGFFDDSVAFTGVLVLLALFLMLTRGDAFYTRDRRAVFLIPQLILWVAFAVSFWAVDYMDNLMGVMRLGIVCLWMWLVRSRETAEKELAKELLPVFGGVSVLISLIARYIPILSPMFWENSRMSGFFQYANTNALFLAMGIILLLHGWRSGEKRIYRLVLLLLLFMGMLLTGSRSVLLLWGLWGVTYAIRTRGFRKPFLISCAAFVLLGGGYVAITGDTANVGRIFTIFRSNSTLWGRLLYDRDAVIQLCKKFYGLGRLGYYYSQGTFQSGVYRIKFVHNDFLQLALDYGILALVLLLIFLGWQVLRGRQAGRDKEILLFLCVAALVDFHFQYLFMLMTACLFLDYGEGTREKKRQLRENYIILPVMTVVLLYVGIATGCNRSGRADIALSMLPDYSPAQEKIIHANMGTELSYELAGRLLQKNPYYMTGYIARGYFCASQLAVEECMEAFDKLLELDPYNTEYYQQYGLLLESLEVELQRYGETEKVQEKIALLQQRRDNLPVQLEQMKERTSTLAYRIKDKPVFAYE